MKKILHMPNYLYPHIGGIEQTARDFMNSLVGEYEQKVLCFNSEKKTKTDEVDGIEVTRVGSFAKIASQSLCLGYKKELKKMMKSFQPDIIIFYYPNPFVAHYLLKYRKNKNVKLLLYWHLDITKQKHIAKLFHHQNIKLLEWASLIITTSPNYLEKSKYLPRYKDKCLIVPSCIDENRFVLSPEIITKAQKIRSKYDNKTICFAFGRHVKYKGIDYLIKAATYLDDNYVFLIGGEGPLTNELKLSASTDPRINFLGKLSEDDLKANLLACDIFCFPSIMKNEAFGLALAEAMYYGHPCVTFTIEGSGVNYVSVDKLTGLEAKNQDAEDFAKKIDYLRKNPEEAKKMGANAKTRCETLFLKSVYKENMLKALSILNEPKA